MSNANRGGGATLDAPKAIRVLAAASRRVGLAFATTTLVG
jgi:hypothetical protein